jgi:hypothetical protein
MWGAPSDERTGLSFTIAAGARQRSHYRVQVPWESRPYFTVSDSRLLLLSPPVTRRVTVEIFDPAFTRELTTQLRTHSRYIEAARTTQKTQLPLLLRDASVGVIT